MNLKRLFIRVHRFVDGKKLGKFKIKAVEIPLQPYTHKPLVVTCPHCKGQMYMHKDTLVHPCGGAVYSWHIASGKPRLSVDLRQAG